jgi:hypothetical protein
MEYCPESSPQLPFWFQVLEPAEVENNKSKRDTIRIRGIYSTGAKE